MSGDPIGFSDLLAGTRRHTLLRRGLWLEYATLAWNVVGTVVVLLAAVASGSVALFGFGLDSCLEILASTVVIWHLRDTVGHKERPALLVLGGAFCVLAVYIGVQAIVSVVANREPDASAAGIAWTAITLGAMLALAWGKARTGRELANKVLLTEGRVTLVDGYLAGAVLLGLVLNAIFGWWWADPAAALVIVAYAAREGVAALGEART
jgi:divalent metal cation (Fe/Co/Zn/Cd) transporter